MEFVAGPVQIGGHQVNALLAVLFAIGLKLYELGQFGDPVGSVGLLGVPIPEGVLRKRHLGEFGIRADGADDYQPVGARQPALLDDVGAHEQVVEVEVGGTLLVGPNATHPGGQMDDNVGLGVGQEPLGIVGVAQVVVGAGGGGHQGRFCLIEQSANCLAQESGASGDQNPLSVPEAAHWITD